MKNLFFVLLFFVPLSASADDVGSKEQLAEVVSEQFRIFKKMLVPGAKAHDIEKYIDKEVSLGRFKSTLKGYHAYPFHSMVSINSELIRTPPNDRVLVKGDVVTVEFGVRSKTNSVYQTWSFPVGEISKELTSFYDTGLATLDEAIKYIKPGRSVLGFSKIVQNKVESEKYNVIRDFTGHEFGEGLNLYGDTQLLNFVSRRQSGDFKEGSYYSVLILYTYGKPRVKVSKDGWSAYTADGKTSLAFSHIVRVDEGGAVILSENYK